uniref:Cytochrome P450 n=1 Tax=Rhabditophanes sp. KR3021 TaxID=114890 RepID=A0AC35TW07_9BILA
MILFVVLFTIFTVLLTRSIINYYKNVSRYPRGPFPKPFIGNFLEFPVENTQIYFEELSKMYGPVFTVYLPRPVVVATDFKSLKEALVTKGDAFSSRPLTYPDAFFLVEPGKGIVQNNGKNWVEARRRAIHILKDFGMGTNSMEEKITANSEQLFDYINNNKHASISLLWPFQLCIANIISEITFGFKPSFTEVTRVKNLTTLLDESIKRISGDKRIFLYMFFDKNPWILAFLKLWKVDGIKEHDGFIEIIKQDVKSAKDKWDPKTEPTNFLESYIDRKNKEGKEIEANELEGVIYDIIFAGSETTATTLGHAANILAYYPDKQQKMRDEIEGVVGFDTAVSLNDRKSLPFCKAAILEIQRMANILPFNVLHSTTYDTELNGMSIPANTVVFPQIYNVMKYDEDFVNSDEFMPERFLDADESTINKDMAEKMVAFSMGKRKCAGIALAEQELFLIITRLVQRFKLLVPEGKPKPNLEPVWSEILKAMPYEFRIESVCHP